MDSLLLMVCKARMRRITKAHYLPDSELRERFLVPCVGAAIWPRVGAYFQSCGTYGAITLRTFFFPVCVLGFDFNQMKRFWADRQFYGLDKKKIANRSATALLSREFKYYIQISLVTLCLRQCKVKIILSCRCD